MRGRRGRPSGRSAALRDLLWILLAVLALVVVGSATHLLDRFFGWAGDRLEGQVGEAVGALVLLSAGLAIFALIQGRSSRRESRRHQAESRFRPSSRDARRHLHLDPAEGGDHGDDVREPAGEQSSASPRRMDRRPTLGSTGSTRGPPARARSVRSRHRTGEPLAIDIALKKDGTSSGCTRAS